MHSAILTAGLPHAIGRFAAGGYEVFMRPITPSELGDELILQLGSVRGRIIIHHSWYDGTPSFTLPYAAGSNREESLREKPKPRCRCIERIPTEGDRPAGHLAVFAAALLLHRPPRRVSLPRP